jgi:hypothetical protein
MADNTYLYRVNLLKLSIGYVKERELFTNRYIANLEIKKNLNLNPALLLCINIYSIEYAEI